LWVCVAGAEAGDYLFEKMVTSIKPMKPATLKSGTRYLALVMKPRSRLRAVFASTNGFAKLAPFLILTGVSMDYLTAADQRSGSFKEFMESGSSTSSFRTLDEFGLKEGRGIGTSSSTNSRSIII